MRINLLAALAVMAVVAAGESQAQSVRFEGAASVYASSGTCTDYDPVGEQFTVRFRPGGIGSNPADSGFTYLWGTGGYGLTVPGAIGAAFKVASVTGLFDYGGPTSAQSIRFATQSPATITTTTPSLSVVGVIQNFDEMSGCFATFRLGAVKRLN